MSQSAYIDNKNKEVLVLGKGPAERLDQTYYINSRSRIFY